METSIYAHIRNSESPVFSTGYCSSFFWSTPTTTNWKRCIIHENVLWYLNILTCRYNFQVKMISKMTTVLLRSYSFYHAKLMYVGCALENSLAFTWTNCSFPPSPFFPSFPLRRCVRFLAALWTIKGNWTVRKITQGEKNLAFQLDWFSHVVHCTLKWRPVLLEEGMNTIVGIRHWV